MERRLKIPYGIKDFKRIREEGYYYVDKTAYIRRMEERDSLVFFVRPRRMGKSLFVETLRRYYDVNEKANFKKLFGGLDIGESPTENANGYCVRRQLFDYLRDAYHRTREPNWIEWSHLASAFAYDGDWEPFLRRLAWDYADTTPVRGGLQGEIRLQGYMQAEFGHLKFYLLAPEMELARGFCDFCLFPERVHYGDASHSYLIELKYARAEASEEEMAEKVAEAKAQLAKYRADPSVPSLAHGTTLHQIVYVFRGTALHVLEQISCETMV